jgi:hypothetical protein
MAGRDRLHRLVWLNDVVAMREHLATEEGRADLNRLDVRGNTSLVRRAGRRVRACALTLTHFVVW